MSDVTNYKTQNDHTAQLIAFHHNTKIERNDQLVSCNLFVDSYENEARSNTKKIVHTIQSTKTQIQ